MKPIGTRARRAIAGAVVAILVLGIASVHVLQYRHDVQQIEASMEAIELPTVESLQSAPFSIFVAILSALPADIEAARSIEQRRLALVAEASGLQQALVAPPAEGWLSPYLSRASELVGGVSGAVSLQSEKLTSDVLAASGGNERVRESAATYLANRRTLEELAPRLDGLGPELGLDEVGVVEALESHRLGRQVEGWIERSADVEARALERAQSALDYAGQAERVTRALQQDAPSREIRGAVAAWSDAASEARAAVGILDEAPDDPRAAGLVDALTASARESAERVSDEIGSSLRSVSREYESARREEATVLGALSRFGRRTARRVREFAVASAPELQRMTSDLSAALNTGLNAAAVASSDAMGQTIRAYENSRKPPVQQYIESPEGMATIGVGVVVLGSMFGALGFVVVASSRARGKPASRGGQPKASDDRKASSPPEDRSTGAALDRMVEVADPPDEPPAPAPSDGTGPEVVLEERPGPRVPVDDQLDDQAYETAVASDQVPPPSETLDSLKRLAELRDVGAVTEDEFERKKRELLDRL